MLVLERLSDARRQRAPGARGRTRERGQPGRGLQRPDRAERPLPAAGHPPGAGGRAGSRRPTWTRSRRTAPAPRWATRSRRRRCWRRTARAATGRSAAGWARSSRTSATRQAAAGVGRCDQDGDGDAARRLPQTLHVDEPSSHVDWDGRRGRAADRGPCLAARRAPAPGGCLVVRHQRHQRARDHRGRPPELARWSRAEEPGDRPSAELPVVPWVLSGRSPQAAAGAGRTLAALPRRRGRSPGGCRVRRWRRPARRWTTGRWCWAPTGERCALGRRPRCRAGDAAVVSGVAGEGADGAVMFTGQGASGSGWAGSCTTGSRCSPGPGRGCVSTPSWRAAASRSRAGGAVRDEGRRGGVAGPDGATRSRRCSLSRLALFRLLRVLGCAPGRGAGPLDRRAGRRATRRGCFRLADAARLVAGRARLMQALPAGGAMVAVEADRGRGRRDPAGLSGASGWRSRRSTGRRRWWSPATRTRSSG